MPKNLICVKFLLTWAREFGRAIIFIKMGTQNLHLAFKLLISKEVNSKLQHYIVLNFYE